MPKLTLTRRLTSCEDKNCPALDETNRPGILAVTGDRLGLLDRIRTRGIRGRGEVTSLIPEEKFHEAALARGYTRQ